jgi:hypothetical protein
MKKATVISMILVFAVILCVASSDACAQGKVYKIGDRGPKGGWIFNDKGHYSDGWRYFEAAPYDVLNRRVTWHEAMSFCRQYGGDSGDWGVPGRKTLRIMFHNLRGMGANFSVDHYWSQTQGGGEKAWALDFNMTKEVLVDKNSKFFCRCVRAF